MKKITGLQIQYLYVCHRKLWLYGQGIGMELSSNLVAEGTLIGENTYTRRPKKWRELNLGNLKIDHFDPSTNTVREVKKSPKLEHAHIAQVKYYLYALEQRGVENPNGLLEYPKQRKTLDIELTDADRKDIQGWEAEIQRITQLPTSPELVKKSYCKSCAFYDFCFV
jgi:CRISPR-associated exonuclease Cas4